ncbi:MAG: hypothetical protein NT000_11435 [Proteobacteria bacterium]|nr:hypothetical protein [Pseudomonadota bacterium]
MLKYYYLLIVLLFLGCTKKTETSQLKDGLTVETPVLLDQGKEMISISLESKNRIKSKAHKIVKKNGITNLNSPMVEIGKHVKQTKTLMNQIPGE